MCIRDSFIGFRSRPALCWMDSTFLGNCFYPICKIWPLLSWNSEAQGLSLDSNLDSVKSCGYRNLGNKPDHSGILRVYEMCIRDRESIADRFVALLKKKAMALNVGCAYNPETDLGPVVNAEHKKFICDWIQTGIDEGAELVLDGRDITVPGYENGFFVGPTILDYVKPGMTVGDREIFGPVTVIKLSLIHI